MIDNMDLTTYSGIGAATWALVQAVKYFAPDAKDKARWLALLIALFIGISIKYFENAFIDVDWIRHSIMLIATAFTTSMAHEQGYETIRDIIKKPPPTQ